jgi:hypothetical protein
MFPTVYESKTKPPTKTIMNILMDIVHNFEGELQDAKECKAL